MKKILAVLLLTISSLAGHAQSGQRIYTALMPIQGSTYAQLIPSASVYICTYNSSLACITPVTIYSDKALQHLITQPLIADPKTAVYQYYIQSGTLLLEKVCAPYNQCTTNAVFVTGGAGGVSSILEGTNTTCTPLISGKCQGDVTINASSGIDIQTNGVDNLLQSLLNHVDSSTVKWTNSSGGLESAAVPDATNSSLGAAQCDGITTFCSSGIISAALTGGLQMLVNGSPATQFVVVRPSSGSGTCAGGNVCTVGNSSALLSWACTGVTCNLVPDTTASWVFTGSVLPVGVSAGSVTAVYAYSINSASPFTTAIASTLTCNGQNVRAGTTTWSQGQGTSGALSGITGSNFTGVTCAADLIAGGAPGPSGLTMNVPDIGLIVAYTGSPATIPPAIYVATPLYYNPVLTQLGIDTSGLANGFPITLGSTSIAANSTTTSLSGLTLVSPTFSGTPDASGATQFKLPVAAGATTLAQGEFKYDSTNLNWHGWQNGADNFLALFPVASPPTSGHCVQFLKTTNSWSLQDAGGACGVAGSGITSINGNTGAAQTFESLDSSVTISQPDNTHVNFQATGGASGVQYNPSNTAIIFTGDSQVGDDTNQLGNAITVTAVNCNGTICTLTNSGTNGLAAGDWIRTDQISSPSFLNTPVSGFNIYTTGQTEFQIISTGLSTTQFEFNYALHTGTCASACGTVWTANFLLPYQAANMPFFKTHSSTATQSVLPAGTPSFVTINSGFSTIIGVAPTSPAYLILIGAGNDIANCTAVGTIESNLTSIWNKAHTNGWTVVMSTILPRGWNTLTCPTAYTIFNTLNGWLRGQGKSISNTANGQYWDVLVDGFSILSNNNDGNLKTGTGWSASAFNVYAAAFNNQLATQGTVASYSLINPVLITPTIGDATANSVTTTNGSATNGLVLGKQNGSGGSNPGQNIQGTATDSGLGSITGTINLDDVGYWDLLGSGGLGIDTTNILMGASAPSGICSGVFDGSWEFTKDGAITSCPSGGGTWTTYSSSGLSGMTATQVAIAGSATTITSSKALAGAGAGVTTGPTSSTIGDVSTFSTTTGQLQDSGTLLSSLAPLASPTFTGVPAAPTATGGTNTTQLATTAFVQAAIAAAGTGAGIVTYSGPSLAFTGTQYFPIGGGATSSTTETNVDIDSPAAVTIQNMTVQMSAAPGVGATIVFTWRKNASSTALTCTITGAVATSCSDTTHNFSTAALDLLDIQAVTTGSVVGTPTVVMAAQVGVAAAATGVTSVSNSDGTLTISPTTGAVVASIALGHANTWSAAQALGSSTATTQSAGDNSTKLATTAYADAEGSTGIVSKDTSTPVSVSSTACTGSYNNQNATAGTAVTYNLPTAAACSNGLPKQFCFTNSNNGSAANTGVLTISTSASGQFITFTDGTQSATGGNVTSGGAASDAACVMEVDTTHWQLYVQRGTWTKH